MKSMLVIVLAALLMSAFIVDETLAGGKSGDIVSPIQQMSAQISSQSYCLWCHRSCTGAGSLSGAERRKAISSFEGGDVHPHLLWNLNDFQRSLLVDWEHDWSKSKLIKAKYEPTRLMRLDLFLMSSRYQNRYWSNWMNMTLNVTTVDRSEKRKSFLMGLKPARVRLSSSMALAEENSCLPTPGFNLNRVLIRDRVVCDSWLKLAALQ